jgi:hypothetical protein
VYQATDFQPKFSQAISEVRSWGFLRYDENFEMHKNHATSEFSSWEPSPERLELAADEIHIWRAYLELAEERILLRQLEETLSADEMTRANRFFFQRDRSHFVATRGILRELLRGT